MSRATARRQLSLAVLLCLGGAFVVLVGAGRTWTSVDLPAGPLTEGSVVGLAGADLAPGVRALGLVGLAGVVALAATRRRGRAVVGVVLLLTGAGVVAGVVGPDLTEATRSSGQVAGAGADPASAAVSATAWPWLTAVGGALLALAGGLVVARGRSWPALGEGYETPAARASAPVAPAARSERTLWEALDRGEDPTDTLASSPAPDSRSRPTER